MKGYRAPEQRIKPAYSGKYQPVVAVPIKKADGHKVYRPIVTLGENNSHMLKGEFKKAVDAVAHGTVVLARYNMLRIAKEQA